MTRLLPVMLLALSLVAPAVALGQDDQQQPDAAQIWEKRASKAIKKLGKAVDRLTASDNHLETAEVLSSRELDASQAQWHSLDAVDTDLETLERRVASNPFADLMPWALGLGAPLLLGGGGLALSIGAKRKKAAAVREREREERPRIITLRPPNVRHA